MPAASASVLPPAPAHRSSTCRRGAAPASSAATCEPSSCTSNQPLPCAVSASRCGARAAPSGAGMRTPCGDSGVATALLRSSAFKTFSRVAFSVLTLQIDGRAALRAAPSSAARPEGALERRQQPVGDVAGDRGGVSAGSAAPSRAVSSSVSGESACSEPSAVAAHLGAVMPKARGAAPSASARGVSAPICAAMELLRLRAS